ncbi:MAG: EAL domain-containing protein [Bradyrhizobium sp.]|uniref:bifunctional diguanylate cyclase/phosphodiesterase n=1 Tax=Bradyrhizobium sp. TaxID=376 RepID=UPI001D876373|nr:EAL domain-containing protein [Bradyrhizobium sp.]MBV9565135.1 EAL domain-containing protein [Bradyrhizobium sp.]
MSLSLRNRVRQYFTWRPVPAAASIGIALAVSIAFAAVLLVRHQRDREIANNTGDLATYAMMLSAHLESSFAVLEAVQNGVLDQLHGENVANEQQFVSLVSTLAMHDVLTARVAAIHYVGGLTLVDRRGMLVNSTYYWPMPYRDLSDREYFSVLSARDGPDRFITKPIRNRANGEWTVYVARRISSPNGDFLGILLGEINFSYFQAFFSQVAPQPDAVVSMFDLGGVMLVRQPAVPGIVGTAPNTGAYRLLARGIDRGTTRNASPVDHTDRIIAIDRLPHYPMVVSVSRSVDAILQPWREQRQYIIIASVLLELALAACIALVLRHLKGRERLRALEASLVKAEVDRAVAAESVRFNVAVNAMAQGLCMFDRDHRLTVSNPRFKEMFGLPSTLMTSGSPLAALIRGAVANGSVSIENFRQLRDSFQSASDLSHATSTTWDISDGRSLLVTLDRMPDDGWLMTVADVTERRRAEAQIAHMARHDGLTGLYNRTEFRDRLETVARLAARDVPHAVLFLDLDHFKTVNDTWGHPIGDALLQAVSSRIRHCCRDTDVIARLGGDEFAIIQPLDPDPSRAGALSERIIGELARPFDLAGHQLHIGCSIGIALAPDDGNESDKLLKCADLALYKAKSDGRNCFRFFEPTLDEALQRRRVLELDLRHAVANNEFQLHYQPLIETRSRQVCAFEALPRWYRPDGSTIPSSDFIPVAEKMGLIHSLGRWVLATACREAKKWPVNISLAVNLSPVQFTGRDLVDDVRKALDASGLAPQRLQLEITEGLLLEDAAETVSTLHQLRDLGICIAVDDFGSGYSSLSYLLKFPFDKVKLDRSLITDVGRRDQRDIVVQSIITMCNGLGMRTTGEGVETPEQLTFLQKHGCTEVQGFLISKAAPGKQVPGLLAELSGSAERLERRSKLVTA